MLPKLLNEAYQRGTIRDINEREVKFHSGIEKEEAVMLLKALQTVRPKNTLEVGLAMGASAICFSETANRANQNGVHYAIDPFQYSDWAGIGVKLVQDSNCSENFQLLQGKTHEIFHYFFENRISVDMAFIDGWHTFDYTLVDFFLIDKILNPGGVLAIHDMYAPSKQKVLNFILTHRDYHIIPEFVIRENNRIKTWKFFLWRLFRTPSLIFSWYHWRYQSKSPYGIVFLRKRSSFEPDFDFYKNF